MSFYLSLIAGKIAKILITYFHSGSGYTWPGHIALKIYPDFLSHNNVNFKKVIVVSGTNGKTTTSKIITHVLSQQGLSVTHNKTGGNILNGVVSTIISEMTMFGRINSDIGVFEVDEFTLPSLLKYIQPDVLLLLNLSRDQLDRYGEVDIIVDKWKTAISSLESTTLIFLDDDKYLLRVNDSFSGFSYSFGSDETYLSHTSLYGEFNAKNVNAAVLASLEAGAILPAVVEGLSTFKAAYGRGETIEKFGKSFQLFLAKNPASFNHNLDMLIYQRNLQTPKINPDTLIFILNDEVRDGRDVSWIYDISPSKLMDVCFDRQIYVSGRRCFDMAVRLHYAGVALLEENIECDLEKCVEKVSHNNEVGNVVVLPNYSSMLSFRKILTGKEIL